MKYWIILFTIISSVQCARILCFFPIASKSHLIVFTSLATELARRGHELVVVSPYPISQPPENYTDIDLMPVLKDYLDETLKISVFSFDEMPEILLPIVYWYHGVNMITRIFNNNQYVLALSRDDQVGFDLVICEDFMTEIFFSFADYFKAPLILVSSLAGIHGTNQVIGVPYEQAYVPHTVLPFTNKMTFLQRVYNTLFPLFWDFGNYIFYIPWQENLRKQIFGDKTRSVLESRSNVSLVLLNSHPSITYPRALPPSVIEVGGMHIKPNETALPEEIQVFLDEATEGAILFSMGTNLRSDQLPEDQIQAIIKVFSKLPQRVIWKWESDTPPAGNFKNLLIYNWLPQQQILAHPNLILFITHGGLLSTQEAIYHAVPIVGIPVFLDQKLNMNKAEMGGYGVKLALKNVTEKSLTWAINKAIYDPSILDEVSRLSKQFRDQLQSPLERAVFWTEYVLRHNGTPYMRSAGLDLFWFQRNLLDIITSVLIVTLLTFFLSYKICAYSKRRLSYS